MAFNATKQILKKRLHKTINTSYAHKSSQKVPRLFIYLSDILVLG